MTYFDKKADEVLAALGSDAEQAMEALGKIKISMQIG